MSRRPAVIKLARRKDPSLTFHSYAAPLQGHRGWHGRIADTISCLLRPQDARLPDTTLGAASFSNRFGFDQSTRTHDGDGRQTRGVDKAFRNTLTPKQSPPRAVTRVRAATCFRARLKKWAQADGNERRPEPRANCI